MSDIATVFPIIETIKPLLKVIEDKPFFTHSINTQIGYQSIVYRSVGNPIDVFPEETEDTLSLLRECRGIKFDLHGKIIARPFHKFFNYNERQETSNIDFSKPHYVWEKYDGSMIYPIDIDDEIYLCTKAGVTDISRKCMEWVKEQQDIPYLQFMKKCVSYGYTPIFEWIAPDNRIVLPYQQSNLVLLAIRNIVSGEYFDYSKMIQISGNIPIVESYSSFNIDRIEELRQRQNTEGVVIYFPNELAGGKYLKIKSDWYCLLHKSKEETRHEKNVLRIIFEEKLDDLLPILGEEDKQRILDYSSKVMRSLDTWGSYVKDLFEYCHSLEMSRKECGLYLKETNADLQSVFWKVYDGGNVQEEITKFFLKNVKSQSSVDNIRKYIGTEYYAPSEE